MAGVLSFSMAIVYILKQSKAWGGQRAGSVTSTRDPGPAILSASRVLLGQNSEIFKHQIQYHATYLATLRQKLWLLVL